MSKVRCSVRVVLFVFFALYALLCLEWGTFCIQMERIMYGEQFKKKNAFVFLLNVLFAPISMILAIRRIPQDVVKKYTKRKRTSRG